MKAQQVDVVPVLSPGIAKGLVTVVPRVIPVIGRLLAVVERFGGFNNSLGDDCRFHKMCLFESVIIQVPAGWKGV